MSQFIGYGVKLELKDGKILEGKITKATSKGLVLSDVKFEDGGSSQLFKVRSSQLKDLKVVSVRQKNGKGTGSNGNAANKSSRNKSRNDYSMNSGSQTNGNTSHGGSRHNNNNNNNSRYDSDWANDDVNQIKLQDDFDFQGNLNMFNKKDVFAQLKQQDDVAPELRLVAHNKKKDYEKPKNFDIDEMVIPNAKEDSWHKIDSERPQQQKSDGYLDFESGTDDDDDDDDHEDRQLSNTRDRKNNNQIKHNVEDDDDDDDEGLEFHDADELPITQAVNITHLLHKAAKGSNSGKSKDGSQGNEQMLAKLEQMIIQQSKGSTRRNSSISSKKPTLLKIKDSSKQIATATPVQLLEIERIAQDHFGITAPILIENFAINLAQVIKQKLGGKARLRLENSNAEPLVVILTSDSVRSGARALALGRQLCRTGHIRVITMFTTSVNEIQDSLVKEQLELFKKCGGKVVNKVSSLESAVMSLNSPVEIVIDAMQGFDYNISDIFENIAEAEQADEDVNASDQNRRNNTRNSVSKAETIEQRITDIINWCNNQRGSTKIWSLNVASSFDSGSGVQNFPVAVQATGVICTGWPLSSLPNIKYTLSSLDDVVAVDMGFPRGVYTLQNSLRKFLSFDVFAIEGSIALEL